MLVLREVRSTPKVPRAAFGPGAAAGGASVLAWAASAPGSTAGCWELPQATRWRVTNKGIAKVLRVVMGEVVSGKRLKHPESARHNPQPPRGVSDATPALRARDVPEAPGSPGEITPQ